MLGPADTIADRNDVQGAADRDLGGGIGGLVLAVGLQRRGFEVCVLERQSEIRDGGAGISLWPNALAALDTLDLGEAIRRLGQAISKGGLRKLDGRSGPRFSTKGFMGSLGEGLFV